MAVTLLKVTDPNGVIDAVNSLIELLGDNAYVSTVATEITGTTSLDTLTTGGFYAVAETCVNNPVSTKGFLSVVPGKWVTGACEQLFFAGDGTSTSVKPGKIYKRSYAMTGTDTGAWSDWSFVLDSSMAIGEPFQALGSVSGEVTIDADVANVASFTVGAAITSLKVTTTDEQSKTVSLIITNGGNYTVTWGSTIKWSDGTAPTLTSSGIDIITLITLNQGTSWYGVYAGGFA